jgi:hypothetical protein
MALEGGKTLGPNARRSIERLLADDLLVAPRLGAVRVIESSQESRLRFNAVAAVTVWHLDVEVTCADGALRQAALELWQWHAGPGDEGDEWELVDAPWRPSP